MINATINIALCFNDENEAKSMAVKLNAISPEMNFIFAPTFDGFLKAIAKTDKIDYFIIEDNFKECVASDLIEKLKVSQRYKKSLISVFTLNHRTLDSKYLEFKLDFIFDAKMDISLVHEGLEKSLLKSIMPVIPKHFNILAVDDDPGILELISLNINELGHQKIELCGSVLEAKKLLNEQEFDLILLDWNISDGTCIDVMEYIKKYPVTSRSKNALTMVITGRNSVDDIMTLLRYGVKDTIIKPFDYSEFADKISYALEKHLKKF